MVKAGGRIDLSCTIIIYVHRQTKASLKWGLVRRWQQQSSTKPAFYCPAVETENGAGDDVVIMFNGNTDAEKAWFDGVVHKAGSVQLVGYDEILEALN